MLMTEKISYLYMSKVSPDFATASHLVRNVSTTLFIIAITSLSFPVVNAGVRILRMFFHLSPVTVVSILAIGSGKSNPPFCKSRVKISNKKRIPPGGLVTKVKQINSQSDCNFDVEFCWPVLPHNQIFCLRHFNLRSLSTKHDPITYLGNFTDAQVIPTNQ